MDLEQRLNRAAERNVKGVGGKVGSPSEEATIEGRDKATGQYVVRRNGCTEMAESATTGIIKNGVNAPVVQGKVFAVPHQPRPKTNLSFPQIAKAEPHDVYIAYLPISIGGVYQNVNGASVGFGLGLQVTPLSDIPNNVAATSHDLRAYENFYEGNPRPAAYWTTRESDFNGWHIRGRQYIDGTTISQAERGFGYLVAKEVIDFVFPSDDPFDSASSRVFEVINGSDANILTRPGTAIAFRKYLDGRLGVDIAGIGEGGGTLTNSIRNSITILHGFNEGYGQSNLKSLKQFLLSAFTPNENGIITKKLIIMPIGAPFMNSIHSNSMINPASLRINNAANTIRHRLIGVINHGVGKASERTLIADTRDDSFHAWISNITGGIRTSFDPVLSQPSVSKASSAAGGYGSNSYIEMSLEDYTYRGIHPGDSHDQSHIRHKAFLDKYFGPGGPYGHYWPSIIPPQRPKNQKEFSRLITSLATNIGSTLYVDRSYYFSGVYKEDPLQSLYGDSTTPHFWIKGLTKKNVDSVDIEAIASGFGLSDFEINYNGFRS
jgi:hypothetical protein